MFGIINKNGARFKCRKTCVIMLPLGIGILFHGSVSDWEIWGQAETIDRYGIAMIA